MEINIKVLKTVTVAPYHVVQLEKWSYPTGEDNPPYEMWTIRNRMYSPLHKKTIDIGNAKFYFEDQAYQKFDTLVNAYTTKSIAPLEDRTITSFKKDDTRLNNFIKHNKSYEIYNITPIPAKSENNIIPTPEDVTFYVKIGDDIFTGKCHHDSNDPRWHARYENSIYLKPKDKDSSIKDICLFPDIIRFNCYEFFINEYGIDDKNLFEDIKQKCQDAIDNYMIEERRKIRCGSHMPAPIIHVTSAINGEADFHFIIDSAHKAFSGHYSKNNNGKIIIHDIAKGDKIDFTSIYRNVIMGFAKDGYFGKHYNISDRDLRDSIYYACENALSKMEV